MKVILFLDDKRKASSFIDMRSNIVRQATTYTEFTEELLDLYCLFGKVDEVWFDHDLGDKSGNGYDCAKYLVEFCEENSMKFPTYYIQSANPVGKANIDSYLKSYLKSLSL